MMNICNEYAYDALNKLGAGYKVTSMVGKTRVNASIKAETPQAIQENKKHNTMPGTAVHKYGRITFVHFLDI